MFDTRWIRAYRLFFAALTLVAVVYQLYDGAANRDDFSVSNFFSFFTIQSNIIAAVVLLLLATIWREERSLNVTLLRGGAVAWMTTTGVVYGLLLSGYTDALQTAVPWVNNVLHRIVPIVMVVDWIIERPFHRLTFRQCLVWMAYPLAFLAYSLIRGPIVDWYPYPFLNPDEVGGYAGVAAYSVGIAIGFLGFIWLIVTLGNRPWERGDVTAAAPAR